jgi:hypothetical protein
MRHPFKLLAAAFILLSCQADSDILETLFEFPQELKEVSAVEVTPKSDWIWTLEDSGNDPKLYAFNAKGELLHTLSVTDATNRDWEELTSDKDGNLYIGDFGNNDNVRKDLCIYKIDAGQLKNSEVKSSQKITFFYPEQTEFPPKTSEQFYDLEAFFLYNNNFYLFTKNRSTSSDGTTLMYSIPNQPGNHAAKLLGSFKTCPEFRNCAVTSADISPDEKKVVLLSASSIWLFTNFKKERFLDGKVQQIELGSHSHKEGICFIGNNKLYVTDERKKKSGGKLYRLNLDKLKTKP